MNTIPSTETLQQAAQLRQQIDQLEAELHSLLNGESAPARRTYSNLSQVTNAVPGKRTMAPAARKRISEAQKARWAKFHEGQNQTQQAAAAATAPVETQVSSAPAAPATTVPTQTAPVAAAPAATETKNEVKPAVKPAKSGASLLAAAA